MAGLSAKPTHIPRHRQPRVAGILWPGNRGNPGRLWHPRLSAHASGIAGLAGGRISRGGEEEIGRGGERTSCRLPLSRSPTLPLFPTVVSQIPPPPDSNLRNLSPI